MDAPARNSPIPDSPLRYRADRQQQIQPVQGQIRKQGFQRAFAADQTHRLGQLQRGGQQALRHRFGQRIGDAHAQGLGAAVGQCT
jgi:hypothetical protein